MFERYTEKARRVIFFARYEGGQLCSPYIHPEHLLLGLLREDHQLFRRFLPGCNIRTLQQEIQQKAQEEASEPSPTSVDIPLSDQTRQLLKFAADEADALKHRHIGTEHLLLGILREDTFAASILRVGGANLDILRREFKNLPDPYGYPTATSSYPPSRQSNASLVWASLIEIHDSQKNAEVIRENINRCRERQWHWHYQAWTPRDIVIHRSGTISFDLSLADDPSNYKSLQKGWKKDYCAICHWALFESEDPEHGTGYTNGLLWVCTECHDRFLKHLGDVPSPYSDIT
jgi:hypothetical protein